MPIETNGKPLAAIGKFLNAIGKLMIGKKLAINGEEITNAMIGNDALAIYFRLLSKHFWLQLFFAKDSVSLLFT